MIGFEYDWRDEATCFVEGADPEVFAPVSETGPALAQIAEAKSYCARCPVRQACLDEAVAEGDDTTVRGGLTPTERRTMIRLPMLDAAPAVS